MKLQPDSVEGINYVQAYTPSSITVNGRVWEGSVLFAAQGDVREWPARSVSELTEALFEQVAALDPELVVLGSGPSLRFAHPSVLRPLMARRIGIETMDTHAACRTYNILAAEGRRVAAVLLLAEGRDAPGA